MKNQEEKINKAHNQFFGRHVGLYPSCPEEKRKMIEYDIRYMQKLKEKNNTIKIQGLEISIKKPTKIYDECINYFKNQ